MMTKEEAAQFLDKIIINHEDIPNAKYTVQAICKPKPNVTNLEEKRSFFGFKDYDPTAIVTFDSFMKAFFGLSEGEGEGMMDGLFAGPSVLRSIFISSCKNKTAQEIAKICNAMIIAYGDQAVIGYKASNQRSRIQYIPSPQEIDAACKTTSIEPTTKPIATLGSVVIYNFKTLLAAIIEGLPTQFRAKVYEAVQTPDFLSGDPMRDKVRDLILNIGFYTSSRIRGANGCSVGKDGLLVISIIACIAITVFVLLSL